jgi:hypothetical protein
MIEEITAYIFTYIPWNRNFPIKSCDIIIYAKTRKETELIALQNNHKFFEQDCNCIVIEKPGGYRKIE